MADHPRPATPITWHCAGCGDSGLAPGVCDRCHHEYVADDPGAASAWQTQNGPWRHVATDHAFAAFARLEGVIQWIDLTLGLAVFPLMLGLFLAFAAVASQLPASAPHWARDWSVALCLVAPYVLLMWWAYALRWFVPVAYRSLAAVLLSERAIRRRSRVAALSALEEGPAVVIGETTVVEAVTLLKRPPALAFQSFECARPMPSGEYVWSDGSGGRLRPSLGGTFFVSDDSGARLLVRAEHVVIEAPHLDGVVPLGSRVAASGNVRWVAQEDGYRGGHGHWEMVGTWDQPVILRVLRAGPAPTPATASTRARIDVARETDLPSSTDNGEPDAQGATAGDGVATEEVRTRSRQAPS